MLLAARVRTPINTIIVKKGDLEEGDQSSIKYDGSSRLDLQIDIPEMHNIRRDESVLNVINKNLSLNSL